MGSIVGKAYGTSDVPQPHNLSGLPWSFTPENLRRFTCPPGAYLDDSPTPLAEKERRLQGWVQQLLRQGYQVMPGWEVATQLSGGSFWTFSDPMWPKPARCRPLWGDEQAIFNACLAIFHGRITLNRRYRLILRLVTKAASYSIMTTAQKMLEGTTLFHFFSQDTLVPGSRDQCRQVSDPHDPATTEMSEAGRGREYKLVGNVREPFARFLSGFNMWLPQTKHGDQSTEEIFEELLTRGFECGDYSWGAHEWTVKGWAHFLPSADFFRLPYHLYAPTGTSPYIDKLFRMERLDDVMPYLSSVRAAGPHERRGGGSKNVKQLIWGNVGKQDGSLTKVIMGLVAEKPALMRAFCRAFIQDYICFDYELPEACSDMLQLSR
eukprot:jgi/Mesvir1/27238/Mv07081-RA.1